MTSCLMTSDHIAIRINHIGKKHLFSGLNRNNPTLHDVFINSVKMLFKVFHPASPDEGFRALKDVSFYVEMLYTSSVGTVSGNRYSSRSFPAKQFLVK